MKKTIIPFTLIVVFILMATMSISTFAAYSDLKMGISPNECRGNLSNYAFPESQIPQQGDTFYINLSGTTDFKLDRAEFHVKAPNQSSFSCVYVYDPSGYFRWVNYPYHFSQNGTYTIRLIVKLTNGAQASGEMKFDVAKNTNNSSFSPIWPCESANYISTLYRYWNSGNPKSHGVRSSRYNAIDIAGNRGDSIYAIENGTVVEKGYSASGFGYYVVIKHNNGLCSLYAHMKSGACVNKGDPIKRGQIIGYMGSTGNSSGNHLHFELYNPNKYSEIINPWVTYYQGNINVTIGVNSFKANNAYTNSDSYAKDWCNWLINNCTKNSNGDYVYKR